MIAEKIVAATRRVIVVSHPDDESLWFAGMALRYPGLWTVICCSIPQRDPIRAFKFFAACRELGVRGELLPFAEPAPDGDFLHLEALPLDRFDLVVTHNAAGEYGHRHHVRLHNHVKRRRPDALVTAYGLPTRPALEIRLTDEEWRRKRSAILAYDHRSPSDGGVAKGEALLARYGARFDLGVEGYAG